MSAGHLSDFDRDRVEVTLRRVGAAAADLRREYPEVYDSASPAPSEPSPQAAAAAELAYPHA